MNHCKLVPIAATRCVFNVIVVVLLSNLPFLTTTAFSCKLNRKTFICVNYMSCISSLIKCMILAFTTHIMPGHVSKFILQEIRICTEIKSQKIWNFFQIFLQTVNHYFLVSYLLF